MTQVEEESSPSFYVRQDDADEEHRRNDTTDTTSSPTTVPQHHPGDQTPSSQLPQSQPSTRKSIKSFRYQLKSFGALALPYFRESSQGRWAFFWLVILMLLNSAVRVIFSYLARDFWSALADNDQALFYTVVQQFLVAMLSLVPINVLYTFQQGRLAIFWREWMTQRLWKFYVQERSYYTLEQQCQSTTEITIDNPDQRIAEDVRAFTTYSLSFFLTLSLSFIDVIAFSVVLLSIQPSLFACILGFALFGTLTTILIGKALVRLNFERFQKEADFRFSLVRFREHAEAIAFYRAEALEGSLILTRLQRVVDNAKQLIGLQRNLAFFTQSYTYLTWILPIVVIAPRYFAGEVELGVIQQAVSSFGYVLSDMSVVITEFESLTQFSASIDRLVSFVRAIRPSESSTDTSCEEETTTSLLDLPPVSATASHSDTFAQNRTIEMPSSSTNLKVYEPPDDLENQRGLKMYQTFPSAASHSLYKTIHLHQVENSDKALEIQNVTLKIPNSDRTLIENLNLSISWGQQMLIVGPSGIGKSSLLRAMAGLWTSGTGSIRRTSNVYFLPQRPYCPMGTLRDQLLYPAIENRTSSDSVEEDCLPPASLLHHIWTDPQLLEVLKRVDLGDLASRVGGLDAVLDWSNTLSLGEQQRIAFARVLVHRPRLVILDEATSAMDVHGEARLYGLLKTLTPRDGGEFSTTYISVGHRPTLLAQHDVRLEILGPGQHGTHPIESASTDHLVSNEVKLFFD